jgi:hypothetical protein
MERRGGGNIHAAVPGSVGAVGEKALIQQLEEKQFNKPTRQNLPAES